MKLKFINNLFLGLAITGLIVKPAVVNAYDPLENEQWYLDQIKAEQAWQITTGSEDIVVAVLDTGVDANHPDLKNNLWVNQQEIPGDGLDNDLNGYVDDVYGWNFMARTAMAEPDITARYDVDAVRHGTFVAGIISAVHDNNQGIKGVTANVKIMPLIVLDSRGYGDSPAVSAAINYAVDNGAHVINLSFVGDDFSPGLRQAVINAYEHNVPIVAAAGNSLPRGLDMAAYKMYPICYDQEWSPNMIIGVGATDQNNHVSYFSNYGGGCIDIAAPGEMITSLVYNNDSNQDFASLTESGYDGTSFGTAMVSGTIALMLSVNPHLTVDEIQKIIQQTAIKIDQLNPEINGGYGAGLINSAAAVEQARIIGAAGLQADFYVAANRDKAAFLQHYNSKFQWQSEINILGSEVQGINLTAADLDLDGQNDLLLGAAAGNAPLVRGLSFEYRLLGSFLAFENEFRGGVRAAAGDVDGDGLINYAAVPQSAREPVVRVFDQAGKLQTEFLAFDKNLTSGITVAVGNVLGDDRAEILVGAPAGHSPEVRIFDQHGNLLKTVMMFVPQFTGGVNVAAANLDSQGYWEIIGGAGAGGGPHVRAVNADGVQFTSFFVYNPSFRGGIYAAAADVDRDGVMEIITSPGAGGGPHVRIWNLSGQMLGEFFGFEAEYTGGIQTVAR